MVSFPYDLVKKFTKSVFPVESTSGNIIIGSQRKKLGQTVMLRTCLCLTYFKR